MAEYILIFVFGIIAGISQGVCGFGAGIVMMVLLPELFPMSQAASIAGVISLALIVMMVVRYRKHIAVKKALLPLVLYAAASVAAIHFSSMVDQELLKRLFGAFLICITLHHFLSKKEAKKWSLPVSVLAIAFSGVCSGLFSVGGPLMVLYYIANTDSKEEFLGTTEFLFMLNLLLSTYLRIKNGYLLPEHAFPTLIGVVGIALGFIVANKIIDRVDGAKLKNIVYIGVGISGVLNLLGI